MARALRAWAIREREKTRSVTYGTDRENEVSKRYVVTDEDVNEKRIQHTC